MPSGLSLPIVVRLGTTALFLLLLYVMLTMVHPELVASTAIGTDASNYYAAGLRLNDGHPLYALTPGDRLVPLNPPLWTVPLLSPPLIAVLWRPLALLGDASMVLWWAAGMALLVACTLWVIAHGTPNRNTVLVLVLPAVAFAAVSGNLNTLLATLCVGAAVAASRGRSSTAGVLIGIAGALKLTPALLIFWFVIQRDWAAVRAFLVTVAVLGVIQLAGAGLENNLAYLGVMRDTATTGATPYSVVGVLRNLGAPESLAGASTFLVMAAGIVAAWLFRRRPAWGWIILCTVVLFASPVVMFGSYAILLAAFVPITAVALAKVTRLA